MEEARHEKYLALLRAAAAAPADRTARLPAATLVGPLGTRGQETPINYHLPPAQALSAAPAIHAGADPDSEAGLEAMARQTQAATLIRIPQHVAVAMSVVGIVARRALNASINQRQTGRLHRFRRVVLLGSVRLPNAHRVAAQPRGAETGRVNLGRDRRGVGRRIYVRRRNPIVTTEAQQGPAG